jgi:hypothetical protein
VNDHLPFLKPRLVGERFENAAIPLEVLRDLAALEEMVVEVAKWRFLQDHPARKRTPRGFTSGISLKVTAIEDGSAIPVIGLFVASLGLFPDANQLYFERAREQIISAIDAAEHNEPIAPHLPDSLLGYFDRLGRSLRDGESIEFRPTDTERPARLTKATRRKLVLASSQVKELTEDVTLRGRVPQADQDKMTFIVQLINGTRVPASVGTEHIDTVIEAFNGYRSGVRIALQGIGRYNRLERLQGIDAVQHISLLDSNDIDARLDELRALRAGWLDGLGEALRSSGVDWLGNAFQRYYPDHLPLPFLYPTVEGGVQAEWSLPPHEVSITVSLETRRGEWHSLNLDDDTEGSQEVDLESADGWAWLSSEIARLGEIHD